MNIASPASNLKAALHYASLGYRVFPIHGFINGSCSCCHSPCPGTSKPGKHPACSHGYKDATTDEAKIIEFFDGKPWLNVGIAPDEHTLVSDIDPAKGGSESLAQWEAEHGPLPKSPSVKTGSDGRHFYYKLPSGIIVKNKAEELGSQKIHTPGIDTRSAGGYLVAPPSLHECGERYEWLDLLTRPEDLPLAPDWLIAIVAENPTATASPPSPKAEPEQGMKFVCSGEEPCDFSSHPGAAEGNRRKQCCRLTGIHADRGDSLKTIEAMAIEWAKRCDPPYTEAEALTHVRGIFAKEEAKRGELVSFPSQKPESESQGAKPLSSSPLLSAPGPEPEDEPEPEPEEEAEADAWPNLSPEAYHGLAGEIVRAVGPETEADPVGILLSLLTAFGNAVGKAPHFAMSSGVHQANLYSALVGDTASGKGQSWGVLEKFMAKAESEWYRSSVGGGLSSGEGLVERLKDGDEEDVPAEKRLLCVVEEFARPITAMRREGNTLSPILRSAWDGRPLEVMTRGKSKLKASNAHLSILANVTVEELQKIIGESVEVANGFSNRFLWALVRRSNILPEGGNPFVLSRFIGPMAEAIIKAKDISRVERDAEAKALWAEVYESLSTAKPGAFGKATSRGHAQCLRLSLLYALLDGSSVITASHLRAALALWRYCEASARLIFGGGVAGTKEGREREQEASLDFRLLEAIEQTPGIKRTALIQATASRKRGEVPDALASLQAMRLAHPRQCQSEGGGRPSECWFPGPGDEPKPGPKPSSGMKFTCSGDDEGDAGGDLYAGAFAPAPKPPAIGSSERHYVPDDEGREVGEGKEIISSGSGQTELVSFPSQLPDANEPGMEAELVSFPSQLPDAKAWDGNSDEPKPSFLQALANSIAAKHGLKPPDIDGVEDDDEEEPEEEPEVGDEPEPGADARAVTLMESIYLKGMNPIEAFKAFGVEVKSLAEIEAERIKEEEEPGAKAKAEDPKAEGVTSPSPSPLLSSQEQAEEPEPEPVEEGPEPKGMTSVHTLTPEVEPGIGEEEEMPENHLEAVAEWQSVLEARVKALLQGDGKVEQSDIPCLAPGWPEAVAKRLYRSAMRTAPEKGKPLPVPKGIRKGDKGLLEDTSLGWLHRTIEGDIQREAKAKALREGEMPEEEFMAELHASLEAIERSNANA